MPASLTAGSRQISAFGARHVVAQASSLSQISRRTCVAHLLADHNGGSGGRRLVGEISFEQGTAHPAGHVDSADMTESGGDVVGVQTRIRAPAVQPEPLVAAISGLASNA